MIHLPRAPHLEDSEKAGCWKTEHGELWEAQVLRLRMSETGGITKKATSLISSFVSDIFKKIYIEAWRISRYNKKPMIMSRGI